MLIYKKVYNDGSKAKEISYEEALNTLLGCYKDNDMTRDMLTIPNRIHCQFSAVFVSELDDKGIETVLMPGLFNLLPMEAEYDDKGRRTN